MSCDLQYFSGGEPGGNRNRSINIKAQHKTRRAAITQTTFTTFNTKKLTFRLYPKTISKQMNTII